jgi:hypothetical protein
MPPGAQKGFLGDILCVVRITQEKVGQPENRLLMDSHQRFPGCRVTVYRMAD